MEQLDSHWANFYVVTYFGIFLKSVEEVQVLITKYCLGDQIKKNEIGVVCSTYGGLGEVYVYIALWWGSLRE